MKNKIKNKMKKHQKTSKKKQSKKHKLIFFYLYIIYTASCTTQDNLQ